MEIVHDNRPRNRQDVFERYSGNHPRQEANFLQQVILVKKASGGRRPVIDPSPHNNFVTLSKLEMIIVAPVMASVRKDIIMFSIY